MLVVVFLGLLAAACGRGEEKSVVFPPAPEFSLPGLEGGRLDSADLKGQVLFLHFWATWCKYCVHEIPELNELYAEYGKRGVRFLAVSLDEEGAAAVKALQQEVAIDYPVALGNMRIVEDFGNFRGLPSTFIITPDWKIYRHIRGYVPRSALEQALDAALQK